MTSISRMLKVMKVMGSFLMKTPLAPWYAYMGSGGRNNLSARKATKKSGHSAAFISLCLVGLLLNLVEFEDPRKVVNRLTSARGIVHGKCQNNCGSGHSHIHLHTIIPNECLRFSKTGT